MLSEHREWTGHWWFPAEPEDRVPGVLTYDPDDGLMLRLIGGWKYQRLMQPGGGSTVVGSDSDGLWPIIHGMGSGKQVTLIDCLPIGRQTIITTVAGFSGRPDTQTVRANSALIGCHVETVEDAVFVTGIVTVENLTAWSQRSGIELRWPLDADGSRLIAGGDVHLDRIDPLVADLGSLVAKLHTVSTLPYSEESRAGRVGRITERASVEFTSHEPRSMRDMLDALSGVSDLVSLSTLSACADITVTVFLPPEGEAAAKGRLGREVAVYENRIVTPKPDAKAADYRDFIMTLDDIEFSELMPRWHDVRERFSAARAMILGLSYVTGGYLETRVVTAVAAAEAMHRALGPAAPLPQSDFRSVRRSMLDAVPVELREWVGERLPRNEQTLRERLLDLAARPGTFMEELVASAESWARAAKNARNNLAHLGTSDKHSTDELEAVVEVTAAVVALNLLAELGVPEERMRRAIRVHPRLSWAAKLARNHFAG